jgi:hypothetical protein
MGDVLLDRKSGFLTIIPGWEMIHFLFFVDGMSGIDKIKI